MDLQRTLLLVASVVGPCNAVHVDYNQWLKWYALAGGTLSIKVQRAETRGLNGQQRGLWTSARHVEIARTCSKLVADRVEAKFHYAVWFEAGRGPASSY